MGTSSLHTYIMRYLLLYWNVLTEKDRVSFIVYAGILALWMYECQCFISYWNFAGSKFFPIEDFPAASFLCGKTPRSARRSSTISIFIPFFASLPSSTILDILGEVIMTRKQHVCDSGARDVDRTLQIKTNEVARTDPAGWQAFNQMFLTRSFIQLVRFYCIILGITTTRRGDLPVAFF